MISHQIDAIKIVLNLGNLFIYLKNLKLNKIYILNKNLKRLIITSTELNFIYLLLLKLLECLSIV